MQMNGSGHAAMYSETQSGLENFPKARALYDYEAEVHGDLTLRAGDIIAITDREDTNGWWTGQIGGRSGLFPSTYVEVIDEGPMPELHQREPEEGDVLEARFDYGDGGAEELKFEIGDRILLQAKDESGWWLGKLLKNGVVGWFAPDLVAPLNDSEQMETMNTTPDVAHDITQDISQDTITPQASDAASPFSFNQSLIANTLPASPKKAVIRISKKTQQPVIPIVNEEKAASPKQTNEFEEVEPLNDESVEVDSNQFPVIPYAQLK